ncbi:MAG: spermidine synthase [Desulfosarcina sp.]|nr:spermidine synthase [Desulfobacterales bacterium]
MARSWKTLDRVVTVEGALELRQRSQNDFIITVDGRILMNSAAHRSETALGLQACRLLKKHPCPRVLVGGLGMGFTLKAVLETLPPVGRVVVAEINPVVVTWCRDRLAHLTNGAVFDSRVTITMGDVADLIRTTASDQTAEGFDAVILDLYSGPHARTDKRNDPLYGTTAIAATRAVINPGGVFAVWGEDYDAGFEKRLRSAGFAVTSERQGRGGPAHAVYLAIRQSGERKSRPSASRSRPNPQSAAKK